MPHKQKFNLQKTVPKDSKSKAALVSKTKWWTPVWNGLPVDAGAKHYRAMGSAVWLYLYLLVYSNRETGKLFRRIPTIATDTGLSSRTISRWLNTLKTHGYVESRQTGRSLQISVTKWKSIKKS
jgi:DNA-binding transcriptional ArsR family regulator